MEFGLSRDDLATLAVIGAMMLLASILAFYQLRTLVAQGLTFPEVLRYCEEGFGIVGYQKPVPHLQVFFLQNSKVRIKYAQVRYGTDVVEVIEARYLFARDGLQVHFRNKTISRLGDYICTPSNRPINCSAMYDLRTMAEKTASEYLRVYNSVSSS